MKLKTFVTDKMEKQLLAAIEEFNALLPNVINNSAPVIDRFREIDVIIDKIETIIIEKYVYETETFLNDFESIMNNELMDVVSECNYRLVECGGAQHHERVAEAWYPVHIAMFHTIAEVAYHVRDFYYETFETGIPASYGKQ